jgi:hypothetical protein
LNGGRDNESYHRIRVSVGPAFAVVHSTCGSG